MGNVISLCCTGKLEKYRDKKLKQPEQPTQDETEMRVVTITGATVDKTTDHSQAGKTKSKSFSEGEKNKEKRNGSVTQTVYKRKKGRRRRYSSSDDSTDSSDSTSSSDTGGGQVSSSRKVYKNKTGGTTIVSKKMIIGGNVTKIGKNAGNVVINIGSNSRSKPKVNTNRSQRTSSQSPDKVFSSFYTDTAAKEEERKQFASPWGQGLPTSAAQGNFINVRTAPVRRYVFTTSVEVEAAKWVCHICYPGGSGTGFRVGSRYIMTAWHVVQEILERGHRLIGPTQNHGQYAALAQPGVFARFNFLTDTQPSNRDRWTFKPLVRFSDSEVDTAVLELEDSPLGTPMPPQFTEFSIPVLSDKFTFIGHTGSDPQQLDIVDKCLDTNSEETRRDIITVKQQSLLLAGRDYEFPPHRLDRSDRFLFHCTFSKGASGSPGVVVLADGRVVVVTMLLRGFPDWYYDPNLPQDVKDIWPKQYCVEQGSNMMIVYDKMMANNPALCQEIFGFQNRQGHESGPEFLPPPDL